LSYRIADEPVPSRFSHLAVHPLWPLLAMMLAGAWLSWPWYAVNGFALGSPTRRRELVVALGGFLAVFATLWGLGTAIEMGWLGELSRRYAPIPLSVVKLGISYWLFVAQARSFQLYEHFGGVVRNGLLLTLAGTFLRPQIFQLLPEWLQAIVG
jgi:hypothetical protein